MSLPTDGMTDGCAETGSAPQTTVREKLGRLHRGEKGTIVAVGGAENDAAHVNRLLQMGLVEGAEVEVVHEAPISRDPIAVRVRGSLLALRRKEADAVVVELRSASLSSAGEEENDFRSET